MKTPETPTKPLLEPGEVIYAPGWDYCYQVVSGPFCRINFVQWQGRLASTPSDPQLYISYLIRALGSKNVSRVIIKSTNFQAGFR
ncbi:hypothetical protein IQ268_24145 [Oculatella sp. LEGE 06141]|uniref:hypothetical protein n=1 Tax=Oculatella sp. LEGE 06141 TaxID=1828648 RepID=UPI00187E5463|nr:hypothetical protein [Oculatella sp. LEGE 06141]MBE9181660.1 hypothetical protein [Oculatella sp. LEGE 06141]